MQMSAALMSNLRAVVGAIIGGVLGFYTFSWLVYQGFYGLWLPGAFLGLGCGLLSQHCSISRGIICAVAALGLSFLAEWRFFPFLADSSLLYMVAHLGQLSSVTVVMMGIGSASAFWLGKACFIKGLDHLEGVDHAGLRYPILRMTSGFFKSKVVAIYETHLLIGTYYLLPLHLTEEMCHVTGEHLLRRKLHRSARIEDSGIIEILEAYEGSRKRWSAIPDNPRPSEFTIRPKRGRKLHFSIPALQVKSVRAALGTRFADRYVVRQLTIVPGSLSGSAALMGMISLILGFSSRSFGLTATGLIATLLGWYFLFHQGPRAPIGELSTYPLQSATLRVRGREGRRFAARSRLLGWTLKLLGLVYLVVIAIPLADRFRKNDREPYNPARDQLLVFIWLLRTDD
jgi:hypothetical protein